MTMTTRTKMELQLTVRQNTTVLPRILQVLSRRGFTVTSLQTNGPANETCLSMTVLGPAKWEHALPQLLLRLVDVHEASAQELANA